MSEKNPTNFLFLNDEIGFKMWEFFVNFSVKNDFTKKTI